MLHTWSLDNLNLRGVWLTIGSFDGIHLGHQAILTKIILGAHENGMPAVALTFHPHPSIVLGKRSGPFYLNTPEEKINFLSFMGLDLLVVHPFNHQIANLSAREFISRLKQRLNFSFLCVGSDFAIGHNREGDLATLRLLGTEFDFHVMVMDSIQIDGRAVSSSWVRDALASGDMATVQRLLGRPYRVSGEVVRGDNRGKGLGFPTANLDIWSERILPKNGVYACWVQINGENIPAVTNIGYRPTFENQSALPRVETHLLDFEGDLYYRRISLSFVSHLRDEQRFASPQQLVEQVREDVRKAREILEVTNNETILGVASTYS
jgi:riboflavin kinase / FMN adenylyltransferase